LQLAISRPYGGLSSIRIWIFYSDQAEISSDMKLKDIFILAANREKASHEFYLGLAQIHPAGEVRRLIERLAAQELAHKERVEFLYTEVAFPQTNGG